MVKYKIWVFHFVTLYSTLSIAQTTNFGEFVVAEGTQFSNEQAFVNTTGGSFINDGETLLYGDLVNDGMLDFIGSDSVINFSASIPQDISGTEICFVNNIIFNNTNEGLNDISLNNTLRVASQANFVNGIVNSESALGTFIFEDESLAQVNGNDSFVDGEVIKEGSNAFVFPIGDIEFYRPGAISEPSGNSSEFTAKYFFENPDPLFPLASKRGVIAFVDNTEYWRIENTSGNDQVFVTLSWDTATTPVDITSAPNAIHVLHWNETELVWEDAGGLVDAVNNTVTTRTSISDYGVFTLGRVREEFVLPGGEGIYNAISTRNDGLNDFFLIEGIEDLVNNQVDVYNRWGVEVFSTKDYGSNNNVFRGLRKRGGQSSNGSEFLPTGTYFYVLSYDFNSDIDGDFPDRVERTGYIYVNSD